MANDDYETRLLDKSCWEIRDKAGIRMHVCCFLFIGEDKAMLVDTGFGRGDLKAVVDSLTSLPVMLVNTHADGDHVGCNGLFEKAYMHPAEFAYYYETCPKGAVAVPLWEGEVIDLGGRQFEVILIPGHTTGSIALLDRENRILVSGDSIAESTIFMFGKGRSLQAHIYSMKKLLTCSDAFDAIYPAHGPCPIGKDIIDKLIRGAERVLTGTVEGTDPPFPIPAKVYKAEGAAFFYSFDE